MLTEAEIEQILTHGEDDKIEFKQELRLKPIEARAEFIRDMLALVNAHGDRKGYLLIGITSAAAPIDVTHLGLRDENIQQSLNEAVEPPIRCHLREANCRGKAIAYIEVEPSHVRPHVVKKQIGTILEAGDTFIRRGSSKRRPTAYDHEEFCRSRSAANERRPDLRIRFADDMLRDLETKAVWHRAGDALMRRIPGDDFMGRPLVKTMRVSFVIENVGTKKATDVRFEFTVPDQAFIESDSHRGEVWNKGAQRSFWVTAQEVMHHVPYVPEGFLRLAFADRREFVFSYRVYEENAPVPLEGQISLTVS